MSLAIPSIEATAAIFVVKSDLDLNGETIVLPDNSTLRVKNGSINNGLLKGTGIKIVAKNQVVFGPQLKTEFIRTNLSASWYSNIEDSFSTNCECIISIPSGVYEIKKEGFVSIKNSLSGGKNTVIKHSCIFTIGDNITINDINWDGQDKAAFWMYSQPNNLSIRNCSFENYYGTSSGIVSWAHGEKDTRNLLVEGCRFGRVGAFENGIEGDNEGASVALYTYRCSNVRIINNIFSGQYGYEDADAIKLEGGKIDVPGNFPIASGESYKYDAIDALIDGNTFVNVPKSPVKLFASGVTMTNNVITSSSGTRTAIVRMFRSEDNVVENNTSNFCGEVPNVISVVSCKNCLFRNNSFKDTSTSGGQFSSVIHIETSKSLFVDGFIAEYASSSAISNNQTLIRLSGSDIHFNNLDINVPYSYYGIFAPNTLEDFTLSNSRLSIIKGVQYTFLINNNAKTPSGKVLFENCIMDMGDETISSASSYGSVSAESFQLSNSDVNFSKSISVNADDISVDRSKLYGLNVIRCERISIKNTTFSNTYSPLVIGKFDNGGSMNVEDISVPEVMLSAIRLGSNAPSYYSIKNISGPNINQATIIHFDHPNPVEEAMRRSAIYK